MYPVSKIFTNKPCSRGCILNWTNFNQKAPVWQQCDCSHKNKIKIIN